MSNQDQLVRRIAILQKVSLGAVAIYFAAKYLFKTGEAISNIFIVLLLGIVLYRSYLQFKLTGDKTKLILVGVALVIAIGFGAYLYLNPKV